MSFKGTSTPVKGDSRRKQKYFIPMKDSGKGYKEYYLTPELEKEFRRLFPVTMNRDMMGLFGLSFSTMQRFKRELGLEKNMKVIRKKHAARIKRACEKNGYYDSIRGKRPTQQCFDAYRKLLDEGWHPMKALKEKDPKRFRRICRERGKKIGNMLKAERRRVDLGLWQKTNCHIPVYLYTKSQKNHRRNCKEYGYIPGNMREDSGERYTIYYTDETARSKRFETNLVKDGFTIKYINL